MSHSSHARALAASIAFVCAAGPLGAQQVNTALAALSINGTGKVDPATGLVIPTTSQSAPVPPGGAPLYWHRAAAKGELEFRVQGTPGAPVVLVAGAPSAPLNLGAPGLLEISLASMTVVVDGTNPSSLFNLAAVVGSSGAWNLTLGQGVPGPLPPMHFQAALLDPTAPLGVRLTGSITLDVRNDLDTLVRNVADAFAQSADQPLYGPSLCAPGFLFNGAGPSAVFTAGGDDEPASTTVLGIAANATNVAAPPTGGPTPGQTVVFAADLDETHPTSCVGVAAGKRDRLYDLQATETLGAWKWRGNQRAVSVEADIAFYAAAPAPAAPSFTELEFHVSNDGGYPASIVSATVTGPQMAAVTGSNPGLVAVSAASGTLVVAATDPEAFGFTVRVGSTGTSRAPLVEDASGPRDVYQVSVQWSDATTSGPYTLALRAPADPFAAPASIVAAIPALGTPTFTLTNAGTPTANLAVTFAVGAHPAPGAWSAVHVIVDQNGTRHEFKNLLLDPTTPTQTLNLCTPGLLSGVPSAVRFERRDIFENHYRRDFTPTF
ncbi:MAG TPA: hypothetical protein VEI02_11790 [Planctomycetota bacterium]|nr:hypothetical protein [Planctomycetota bacterium]